MLTDLLRYDVGRLAASLAGLRVPVLALQTTFSNEKRERSTMKQGQTTPYLDMLRGRVPSLRVEIAEDTGHFPQLDDSARTTAAIERFLATLPSIGLRAAAQTSKRRQLLRRHGANPHPGECRRLLRPQRAQRSGRQDA